MKSEELKVAQNISGEVRISLQDYHEMVASATKAKMAFDRYNEAIEVTKKFLSFLRTQVDEFDRYIEQFNKENPNLTMYIDSTGKVGVNLNLTRE